MKVAVSIPDVLSAQADEAARELGTTRSGLYGMALGEFLQARMRERITASLDEVAEEIGDEAAEFVGQAGRTTFRRSQW